MNELEFFDFCQERERVRIAKEAGMPRPWTEDQVLQRNYFCNIYREDDKTTRWFAKHVRDKVKDSPTRAVQAVLAFRWFNKIETGAEIHEWLVGQWDSDAVKQVLGQMITNGRKIFNGAYIISAPNAGGSKLDWACRCIDESLANIDAILDACQISIQEAWNHLRGHRGLGPFMAYEAVTDLRWTCVLENAPDIMKWANPGPGCIRGASWIKFGNNVTLSRADIGDLVFPLMKRLLTMSLDYDWQRPWEMREVEHALCEYDKWKRGHDGSKLKRRYAGM